MGQAQATGASSNNHDFKWIAPHDSISFRFMPFLFVVGRGIGFQPDG